MQTTSNRAVPERFWHGLAILAAVLIALTAPLHRDPFSIHGQIIDWYAQQLRAGNGLVFNPGQPVLLIPSPLYMILRAFSEDYILYIVTIAIGAFSLFRIARRLELPPTLAGVASILYAFLASLAGFDTGFPLAGALCLVTLDLGLSARWRLAGLVATLAILCRPEALILMLTLLVLAVNRNAGQRYGLVMSFSLAATVLVLRLYYGPNFIDGLLSLKLITTDASRLGILIASSLIMDALAIWGWRKNRSNRIVALCGVWTVLYLSIEGFLLRTADIASYTLIAGPLALLTIAGLYKLGNRYRLTLFTPAWISLVVAFLASGGIYDYLGPSSTEFSQYKSIGGPTASEALLLRFSPNQVVIAFDGQLQPDLKLMIERDDIQSALIRYAPEILFTDESSSIRPDRLTSGPWARLDYRPMSENAPDIYQRHAKIGEFVDRQVSAAYGTDIQLIGMALDQSILTPGRLVRVRLDWKFARPPSKPVTIDVWVVDGDSVHARTTDEFAARVFENEWSTYHTLTLAKDAWPGPVTVMVGVIVSDGVIARVPVAMLDVVPSE
jgi:hypothetical protein